MYFDKGFVLFYTYFQISTSFQGRETEGNAYNTDMYSTLQVLCTDLITPSHLGPMGVECYN